MVDILATIEYKSPSSIDEVLSELYAQTAASRFSSSAMSIGLAITMQ